MRCLRVSVQAGLTPDRLGPRPDRSSAALGCGPRRADGELAQTAPTRSGKELAMSVIKKNNKNNRTNPKRVNFRGQKRGKKRELRHFCAQVISVQKETFWGTSICAQGLYERLKLEGMDCGRGW